MSKHNKHNKSQTTIPDTASSLIDLAEPTDAELQVIAAEEQGETPTILQQLEAQQAEIQRTMAELAKSIEQAGTIQDKLDAVADYQMYEKELKELESKIDTERFTACQDTILTRLQTIIKEVEATVQIKRLYFEVAELDQDGVKVIKPIVQINDKASALLSKVKASNPDVVAMIEGTANVAPNRAIESLQKKNIESLAWLKEWHQVEA